MAKDKKEEERTFWELFDKQRLVFVGLATFTILAFGTGLTTARVINEFEDVVDWAEAHRNIPMHDEAAIEFHEVHSNIDSLRVAVGTTNIILWCMHNNIQTCPVEPPEFPLGN